MHLKLIWSTCVTLTYQFQVHACIIIIIMVDTDMHIAIHDTDTYNWMLAHTIEPAYAMDARDASVTAIYLLLVAATVLLMAGIDARQLIATSPAMPKALVVRAVMLRARVVGLLAVRPMSM
jgi:hypothetical protein